MYIKQDVFDALWIKLYRGEVRTQSIYHRLSKVTVIGYPDSCI